MKSKRGSALLVAILLSAIMLAALAALLTVALGENRGSFRSYLNTAAFSLAEAGIDRAAAAIADATIFAGATEVASWPAEKSVTFGWYKKTGTTTYRGYFPVEDLDKGRTGICMVICTPTGTNFFDVYSRGVVVGGANGEMVADRALSVTLEKTTQSSAGSGYALAAVSGLRMSQSSTPAFKAGDRTGFPRVASYDSSKGAPNLWTDMTTANASGELKGSNVGDAAMVAVLKGTMNLQNALIYGKVAVAKDASITSNIWSGQRKELYGQTGDAIKDGTTVTMQTAVLVNLNEAKNGVEGVYRGFNLNAAKNVMPDYDQTQAYSVVELATVAKSCVLSNYTFEAGVFDPPVLSELAGYGTGTARTTTADVSAVPITQNTASLTLDASVATYYSNSDGQALNNVTTINVSGTVLLYAPQAFKAENGLTIHYADSSSKLIIYSEGAVRVKMAACPTYTENGVEKEIAPKQFEINVANGSEIDIKSAASVFAGVVKAPKSAINVSTSGNGSGRDSSSITTQMAGRLQLRGQFIADTINLSGADNVDVLYDVQTKGNAAMDSAIKVASWKQILPSVFTAQLN